MGHEKEKLVLREGKDWMDLRKVDPGGRLWLVTGGTLAAAGDIVRIPGLRRVGASADSDAAMGVSPFDAEIVVDSLTRVVLLPGLLQGAGGLLRSLEGAGLDAQARIVRDWLCERTCKRRAA